MNRINPILGLVLGCLACAGAAAGQTGWVLTTDYSSLGRIRSFALESPWTVSADLAVVPDDPVGRWHDGLVYVLGRSGSNILQIFDPAANFSLVREFSLGGGRNVQDIAFDTEGDAYVSCYDQAVLLRVDVRAGVVLETFSTAQFADADGLPETGWMTVVQDHLYVSCQKLDRRSQYQPAGPAALLVFDMIAEQWVDLDPGRAGVQPLALVGANPYGQIKVSHGGWFAGERIWVPCAGNWLVADGGVEIVDPAAGRSEGFLASEGQLGGDLIGVQPTGGDQAFLLVSDSSFITRLRRLDLDSGAATTVATAGGYFFVDLAWDEGGHIYLADRTTGQSGLRVFDAATGSQLNGGVLATGLPPCQIVLATEQGPSPAGPPAAAPRDLALAPAVPNPCNPLARLELTGRPGDQVTGAVFDLRGRCLLRRDLRLGADGRAAFRFEGRDGSGRDLPAGVYTVEVRTSEASASRRVTLVR